MNVRAAKTMVADWVKSFSMEHPTFHSAYLAGSIVERAEESNLPETSDIDVLIILDQEEIPLKPGKIMTQHVLLDVTYLPWSQFKDLHSVLSSYHIANSLKTNTILFDQTGELQHLQQQVAAQFTQKKWVIARCENALQRITNNLDSLPQKKEWADQVMAWLFGTGVMCHVLLVAGLKNPTIRLRYLAVRNLLEAYPQEKWYEELLSFLGCNELTPDRLLVHHTQLEKAFDDAVSCKNTSFFFSTDITDDAKAVAIDGSRDLIVTGNHREAVFWMLATFARCHQIFHVDDQELATYHLEPFNLFLKDLGISRYQDLEERAFKAKQFLPTLTQHARSIIENNSDIVK